MGEIEYKVYTLDSSGHIERVDHLKCPGDEYARMRVGDMLGNQTLELWSGVMFLGRFDPKFKHAASDR